jgi:hypothetical protein
MKFRNRLVFISGRPFQLRLFVSKARAYLSGATLRLLGKPLALSTNIRQGWKGLPGTNTHAYYEHV